jgi:RNA polymerase sigma-70 factor (ECF subfamily)
MQQISSGFKPAEVTSATLSALMLRLLAGLGWAGLLAWPQDDRRPARGNGAVARGLLRQTGTDIRAWLFTIMHNQNVNAVRRAIRDEAGVDIDQISSPLVATTDPTASRQLCELDRALASLGDEQREVILLVGLEGMSYEDAAAILSVPVGTVRSRLSRGRDMLHSLLDMPTGSPRAVLTTITG